MVAYRYCIVEEVQSSCISSPKVLVRSNMENLRMC